jgi:hypothetical protein
MILTEGVFVTQLPSNVAISVSQTVRAVTSCCFTGDILA